MKRDMAPGGPTGDPKKEVQAEIDHYLEERAREFEASGMAPEEARESAARAFGDRGADRGGGTPDPKGT